MAAGSSHANDAMPKALPEAVLIIFPLILQTSIRAQTLSIGG